METVLVVDDELQFRTEVADLVGRLGFSAVPIESTAEALAYLRTHAPPRLILMDLFMPGSDAVVFRREQVGDQAIRAIPMALMVATASLQRLAASVGMPILTKPVGEAELRRVIEALAGREALASNDGRGGR